MHSYTSRNLHNLDAFWSAVAHTSELALKIHRSWPHKVWKPNFSFDLDMIKKDKLAVTICEPDKRFIDNVKLTLQAMALPLEQAEITKNENIEVLRSKADLHAWALACSQAFAYDIDEHALTALLENPSATLFSYKENNEIVGTAIAFQTDEVMGVHQVGVLPHYQGRGIAKALMQYLIDFSKQKGAQLITLQASKAGLPLYEKMGFIPLVKVHHIQSA